MTKGKRLLGSLKSFFGATRSSNGDGAQGNPAYAQARVGNNEGLLEIENAVVSCQKVGAVGTASPFSSTLDSRKSLHRKFLAQTSADLARPLQASFSAIQGAGLHHSISDPCDTSRDPVNTGNGGEEHPASVQAARFKNSQPQGLGNVCASSKWMKLGPRSDAALPSLYDTTRSCSLDLQSGAVSGPLAIEDFTGKAAGVSLPSVEARPCSRPARPVSSSQVYASVEAPPSDAASPSPKTTLLALCPGAPASMRRRDWSLEDYEVTRKIYKGSTSAVYKATCRRSGLPVALKVYFLSRVPSNVIHMIVREIKIHAELVHRNILMLYAAFQDEKRLVLVQEYAARGDLYGIHRAMNRRMTEAQLTTLVLAPFLDALAYLHSRGICHRDIKPENILFSQDWRLMIADFGVSIDLNKERAVTRAGTMEYMAPEVERCPLKILPEENKDKVSLAYTTAVDIWAVGVLAYELMVGFPPFVADGAAATGNAGGGAGVAFLAAHATRKTLSFPASTSALARDFIALTLAEAPEERPTALQLRGHPWLAGVQATSTSPQQPNRRSSGKLGVSLTQLVPSRLGNSPLGSAPNSGGIPAASLAF